MAAPVQLGAMVNTQSFGNAPLSALGIIPIRATYAPTSANVQGPVGTYVPGQVWVDTATNVIYQLSSIVASNGSLSATWVSTGSSTGTLDELIPDTGTSPVVPSAGAITLAGTANQILTTGGTNSVTLSLIGPYTPATYTAHGVLLGEGTSSIAATAAGSNGQVLLGSTGADPAFGTLTTSTGIAYTTGAHSLAINVKSGGFAVTPVAGASQALAAQTTFIANDASLTTFTLPATAAVGDVINIVGSALNTGGWKVTYTTGQIIWGPAGSTTITTGNAASAGAAAQCMTLVCVVTNTTFIIQNNSGTITLT